MTGLTALALTSGDVATRGKALPLLFLLVLALAPTAAAAPPHVIMHLVDDWGRYDIGFRGNAEAVTPNMDALVAEGVAFDRFCE